MPKMDGTGPMGQGPMTGLSRGNCAGAENGTGLGCGRGRGRRGRFFSFLKNERQDLESQEKMLLEKLEEIKVKKEKLNTSK
ncbi:MAG: DUF5320 domain-containing protein [Patescibacteria group bacterium]|nr:DUF5320 domain-containing protein [Patescibacteria group bacterium]MDD4444047.1 DUF5320 domain-containing protein [Patescibacteria group bacterium]